MIRHYCAECGQELKTCDCPEDERFPMVNVSQDYFDSSLAEAYQRGQEDMRERAADLCGEAINAVRPTGRWDPEVRGAQNEAERLERAIRDLEVEP